MRSDKLKQVICISESNAIDFQDRMNEALSNLGDPDIKLFDNAPYTAVITYTVSRTVAENLLELLELVDGESRTCSECPHFVKPEDCRKRWGSCSLKVEKVRSDGRACERFYFSRHMTLEEAAQKYMELPFAVE